jgi:hypothetical protein
MQKIVSCGTLRAVAGFSLVSVALLCPALWFLALAGASLILWALWDVARLEAQEEAERHD